MSKPFSEVWDAAKTNAKRLADCAGPHEFVDATPERTFGKRFRCSLCSGEVDGAARHWYAMGRQHERKANLPGA